MKTNRTLIGATAGLVVAGLVIAGLFAVGSPATARRFKADQRRVEQLTQLHHALLQYFVDNAGLPDTLRVLNRSVLEGYGGVDPRFDPETGKSFEYRKLSDRRYEVCASFHTSSEDARNPNQAFPGYRPTPLDAFASGGFLEYKPGRNCFKPTLTNREISSLYPYPPRLPVPEAPRVPEDEVSPTASD